MELRPSLVIMPALASCILAFATDPATAQSSMGSREFQAAELNELAPDLRAEVLRRVSGDNTPRGVIEVMLLNAMEQRFPASRIVAVDMGRGVVVIQTADKQLKALTFNKQQDLQITGEVMMQ
ncbi:MAG TPA: hypothetical protein VNR89_05965 [Roseomonas sp.]|nr:hypothetical protein [Roseomonas sp.]